MRDGDEEVLGGDDAHVGGNAFGARRQGDYVARRDLGYRHFRFPGAGQALAWIIT